METIEDAVRRLIKEKYGSVTKFAKEVDHSADEHI